MDQHARYRKIVAALAERVTIVGRDPFEGWCRCGRRDCATAALHTTHGNFLLQVCAICPATIEVSDAYPADGDHEAYYAQLGAVGVPQQNDRRVEFGPDVPARLHRGLLPMTCKFCGTLVTTCRGYTTYYQGRTGSDKWVVNAFACPPCSREEKLTEFANDKILTSWIQLQAALESNRAEYQTNASPLDPRLVLAIDAMAEINTAVADFWTIWRDHGREREDCWKMVVGDIEVGSLGSAGRRLVQLDRGDTRLTMITLDDPAEAAGIWVQGIHGTLETVLSLIRDARAGWVAAYSSAVPTQLWIG